MTLNDVRVESTGGLQWGNYDLALTFLGPTEKASRERLLLPQIIWYAWIQSCELVCGLGLSKILAYNRERRGKGGGRWFCMKLS